MKLADLPDYAWFVVHQERNVIAQQQLYYKQPHQESNKTGISPAWSYSGHKSYFSLSTEVIWVKLVEQDVPLDKSHE